MDPKQELDSQASTIGSLMSDVDAPRSGERPGAGRRLVIVSPVRNEEKLLPGTIASVVAQTQRPSLWIIVDDGSTDSTAEIVRAAAAEHDWIRLYQRADRGVRKLGGGVVDAFNDGLEQVDVDYDYVAKMDADLTFGPRYIERLMEHFEADPQLGSASGKVFRPEGDGEVEEFMIDEMVAGQWKLYRRECFEGIGGLVAEVMWDGIDFHKARRAGWRTRSIMEEELKIAHHRLMGSSHKSIYTGRLRWGRGQWFMGSHPLYVLASSGLRMKEKPYLVGGFLIFCGFVQAWLQGNPRYGDREFRRDLQRWQLGRLKALVFRGQVR